MPALRQGDAPAKTGVEVDPAFHPAAAALFRSQPGQAARGARHRPAVDLCGDAADAQGPRICPRRQGALRPRGERPAGHRLPRALFRALRELRLHRRAGGRARRRVGRPRRLAGSARRLLARLQAQGRRGDGAEAVRDHRRARRIPRAVAVSRARGRHRPAAVPGVRQRPAVACAAASSARSSLAPIIPSAASPRSSARRRRTAPARARPSLATASRSRPGASAPMSSAARADAKRASLPKDVPADGLTLEMAEKLLSLPRDHRRASGKRRADRRVDRPLWAVSCCTTANMRGCQSTAEVFETGMNAAVAKLADAAVGPTARAARRASRSRCWARTPRAARS